MPERPSGDRIDQALRAVVTQVGEAASPPPERLADVVKESTIAMPTPIESHSRRQGPLILAGVAAVALIIGVLTLVLRDDEGGSDIGPLDESDPPTEVEVAPTVADAFEAAGGLPGLTLGIAEGAFELVTFDPADPNVMIAAVRDGSGPAENQDTTEQWAVGAGGVEQALWAADIPHDFAHFNPDGSVTRWVLSGAGAGAPVRTADIITTSGEVETTAPVAVARAVVDSGTAFVLTYGAIFDGFDQLIVLQGGEATVLADAATMQWADRPVAGAVLTYPTADGGETRVWDSATGAELPDHPLAGQEAQRIAISGDGSVGARIGLDGVAELFDPATGTAGIALGPVDPTAVEHALTLNADGSLAIAVDTNGTVTVWSTADGEQVFSIDGDAATPRLVGESIGSRATSAVSLDGTRLAIRYPAQGTERVRYEIIDLESWLP